MHKSTDKRLISLIAFILIALIITQLSSHGEEPGPVIIRIEPTGDSDGIFKVNEPLSINVHLENKVKRKIKTVLTCSLTTDEGGPIHSMNQKHDLKLSDKLTQMIKFNVKDPGFYKVIVKCDWEEIITDKIMKKGTSEQIMQIGYDPEKIRPRLTKEPDFDRFWEETTASLRGVDPQFELIDCPEKSTPSLRVYEVKMRSLGEVRI